MKINSFNNSTQYFKGNDNVEKSDNSIPNNDRETETVVTYINPELLKLMHDVQNYSIVQTEEGMEIKAKDLTIRPDTVDKYLRDKNGKIDDTLTKKFISLYNSFLNKEVKNSNQSLKHCQDLRNSFADYMKNNKVEQNDKSQNFANLTDMMLDFQQDMVKYIPSEAYLKTEFLFDLSKKEDSYGFSDISKKVAFYDKFSKFSNSFDRSFDDVPMSQQLLELLTYEDGTIDYKFGDDVLTSLRNVECLPDDLSEIVKNLKKWFDNDESNKDNIIKTVHILNKSDFVWDDGTLVQLVNLCFDEGGKFQIDRSETMLKLVKFAGDNIKSKLHNDGNFNNYDRYIAEELENIINALNN